MELRVLQYFLTVAKEENITKAAALLHLTQPTLSRQLRQLEEELGVMLFERNCRSTVLTADGLRLKRRAQEIMSLVNKTKMEMTHQEELAGDIAIGCGESENMSFLSEKIHAFREKHRMVQFHIHSAAADDIKEGMEQGLLDIGLLTEPVSVERYDFLRMQKKERWGILTVKESPLSKKEAVSAQDLAGTPLLLPGRDKVQHELSSWFGDVFDRLTIAATYNLLNNAANMVRCGVGTALCFDLDCRYDDLLFVPLCPVLETGAVVVWKKDQIFSPAARAFIDCIQKTAERED